MTYRPYYRTAISSYVCAYIIPIPLHIHIDIVALELLYRQRRNRITLNSLCSICRKSFVRVQRAKSTGFPPGKITDKWQYP